MRHSKYKSNAKTTSRSYDGREPMKPLSRLLWSPGKAGAP